LPQNDLGIFVKNRIRFNGVSDDFIQYDASDEARLGTYYYEMGAAPRKPTIVYDRKNASINRIRMQDIPQSVFSETRMFHVSGISLALSQGLQSTAVALIQKFKAGGAQISFDVNYRANLWGESEARAAIEKILPYVDVLFISEETSRRMFGKTGELADLQRSYCTEYGVKIVATTQRTVRSPRKHNFTSCIYCADNDTYYTEHPYTDIDVIDRIGSGDAYVAGALFGLLRYGDPQKALEFGNATSSLKNTVPGDLPSSDFKEVTRIIEEHNAKGPVSEMNR
ncbi:MAG: sugar kinase, partial [Ruthenibacterium sp.]